MAGAARTREIGLRPCCKISPLKLVAKVRATVNRFNRIATVTLRESGYIYIYIYIYNVFCISANIFRIHKALYVTLYASYGLSSKHM